jgi:hypothetical protein
VVSSAPSSVLALVMPLAKPSSPVYSGTIGSSSVTMFEVTYAWLSCSSVSTFSDSDSTSSGDTS